jgi:SRSO17 transposase
VLVEWPADQDALTGYWISNPPPDTPAADLVWWAQMRWRIEHDYRELKHGLGLDHFEGRTWRGWHARGQRLMPVEVPADGPDSRTR